MTVLYTAEVVKEGVLIKRIEVPFSAETPEAAVKYGVELLAQKAEQDYKDKLTAESLPVLTDMHGE